MPLPCLLAGADGRVVAFVETFGRLPSFEQCCFCQAELLIRSWSILLHPSCEASGKTSNSKQLIACKRKSRVLALCIFVKVQSALVQQLDFPQALMVELKPAELMFEPRLDQAESLVAEWLMVLGWELVERFSSSSRADSH